jgi:hypothetical protein
MTTFPSPESIESRCSRRRASRVRRFISPPGYATSAARPDGCPNHRRTCGPRAMSARGHPVRTTLLARAIVRLGFEVGAKIEHEVRPCAARIHPDVQQLLTVQLACRPIDAPRRGPVTNHSSLVEYSPLATIDPEVPITMHVFMPRSVLVVRCTLSFGRRSRPMIAVRPERTMWTDCSLGIVDAFLVRTTENMVGKRDRLRSMSVDERHCLSGYARI